MIPRSILLVAAFLASHSLHSQYYTLGTDPASIRWEQLSTPHFRIIYPVEFAVRAQYVANAFEYAYCPVGRTLDARPRRFPVIIHNRTTYSNAVVPFAPKRIEFMTTPPQDTYPMDWLDQLILHEFRHAVHFTSLDRGFTRALSFLLGQQTIPAVLGAFVPLWFVEGDATVIETAMSRSGRGRDPSFTQGIRAQLIGKGAYAYDKAVHGSYKDHIPDRYELGYHLVGKTRELAGAATWASVMRRTGSMPLVLAPFSLTLRQETGMGKRQLYHHLMASLREEWQIQDHRGKYTPFLAITRPMDEYTDELFAEPLHDSLIVAMQVPLNGIRKMTIMDRHGSVRRQWAAAAKQLHDNVSVHGDLICWPERKDDPRWSLRDYTVIRIMDLSTGKTRQLTHRSRYFAPRFSYDGRHIAVAEVTESGQNALVILDAGTEQVLQRITTPENYFFIGPAWSEDDQEIFAVIQTDQVMGIARISVATGELKLPLPPAAVRLADPFPFGQYILHTSASTGINNIFAVNMVTGKLFQVTSSRFGASNPVVINDGDSLLYSDYTAGGSIIAKIALDPEKWTPWEGSPASPFPLADVLSEQENFIFNRDSVSIEPYNTKPYRKGFNLFNFHSWAPVNIDVDNMDVMPGAMLLSQNLLGTAYTRLGYEYDLNEEAGKYTLSFDYEGLYPAFRFGADYGLRRDIHLGEDHDTIPFKYYELNMEASVYLPLNWNHGKWYRGLRPEAGTGFKYLEMDESSEVDFVRDKIHTMDYSLYLYNQHVSARQDIYPRWGQYLQFNFSHTPFKDDGTNTIFAVQGQFFLPGIIRNHGIRLYAAYQERNEEYYHYGRIINLPRGWSGITGEKLVSLSAGYVLPLFYPDWQIGPVLYVKRFKAAVFYDHAFNPDMPDQSPYNTAGLDLTANFHVMSFLAPIEAGLRSMVFPSDQSYGFQLLFSLDFDSLY